MPTAAKLYFGSVFIGEEPGDPTIPIAQSPAGSYTVPGTLLNNYTASTTFTPPAGVTKVNVVILGGGGKGGDAYNNSTTPQNNHGGAGGEICVYIGVPVNGPVSVTVGGSATNSSFGSLIARAGRTVLNAGSGALNTTYPPPGWDVNMRGSGGVGQYNGSGATWSGNGYPGVLVNGVWYGGGGGGGYGGGQFTGYSGGTGGGGSGAAHNGSTLLRVASAGTNGFGGGGGGATNWSNGNERIGANGGSGRVIVYSG